MRLPDGLKRLVFSESDDYRFEVGDIVVAGWGPLRYMDRTADNPHVWKTAARAVVLGTANIALLVAIAYGSIRLNSSIPRDYTPNAQPREDIVRPAERSVEAVRNVGPPSLEGPYLV